MKKIILSAALSLLMCAGLHAADFIYTDATSLPVFGKACAETYEPFSRLPGRLEGVSRPPVWSLGRNSAGLFVRFSSDSGVFGFKWTSTFRKDLDNMAAIGVRGLALYVLDGKEWVYVGSARPDKKSADSEFKISCTKLKDRMHEYMLYLSLYDGVRSLQVGVPEGKKLEAPKVNSPRAEKPVLIYGTSILQGASASHPGMAGTNQLSRRLDRVVVNLGFSGNALLDYEIAELMASCPDPGAFVLDNLPNGTPDLTREKLEKFFMILRGAHPDVPVVFVEHPRYPRWRFDEAGRKQIDAKNEAMLEIYGKLKKAGQKRIYLVRGDKMLGGSNVGTIEGTHFTDIGFTGWADAICPTLKKVCK